jgi:hypothetical protein
VTGTDARENVNATVVAECRDARRRQDEARRGLVAAGGSISVRRSR